MYYHSHLKHVATLPCETQNAKLSQIMQERCCKTFTKVLSILNRVSIFFFTAKKGTFSYGIYLVSHPVQLCWQQTTYVSIKLCNPKSRNCEKLENLWPFKVIFVSFYVKIKVFLVTFYIEILFLSAMLVTNFWPRICEKPKWCST